MLTSITERIKEIELANAQEDLATKQEKKKILESLRGSLSEYAIRDRSIEEVMELERKACEDAAVERYLRSL